METGAAHRRLSLRDGLPPPTPSASTFSPDSVSLDEKVAFLARPEAYPGAVRTVILRETHMSWVFIAGDEVYKLKKPVRFSYLDFSSLARREAACRAELALNQRLAPGVYKSVAALVGSERGLAIGGAGEVVEWLVVMHRLDERETLENALLLGWLAAWHLDRLTATLAAFYRRAVPAFVSPESHRWAWQRSLAFNRRILLDPRFGLPAGLIGYVDRVQRRFLAKRWRLIADRVGSRRIVDGHGDLRPEHIWLGDAVKIIDCLEFNRQLRAVDPFDEIAFLCVECERLGGRWAGNYIKRRMFHLADGPAEELFSFYRCHRSTLRARLTIAHLLESQPRTPQKWPVLARTYLQLAAIDAKRLESAL